MNDKSIIDNIMSVFEGAKNMGSEKSEYIESPFKDPQSNYSVLPAGRHKLVLSQVEAQERTGRDSKGNPSTYTQLRFRFEELNTGLWSSFACGANFGPKADFAKKWVHQLAENPKFAAAALKDKQAAWKFCQYCVGNLYDGMTVQEEKDGRTYNNLISFSFDKKKGTFTIPDRTYSLEGFEKQERKVETPKPNFEEDLPF